MVACAVIELSLLHADHHTGQKQYPHADPGSGSGPNRDLLQPALLIRVRFGMLTM